jgi:transposase
MYCVGLDLHERYITGCVVDSQGSVVASERRLPPVLETVLGWLVPVGQAAPVALEATLYWAWLHDRLTAAGYPVVVAHPLQGKRICHARCKADPVDARKSADLLRTGLLPAMWIPDVATRARRTLLRGRAWMVRRRTRVKARIQAYLAAENGRVPVSDLFSRGGRAWLAAVTLPLEVREQVDRLLAVVEHLDAHIAAQDRAVRTLARATPAAELLQPIPGIGPFGALLLLAEIGTVARFGSSHELAA